MASPIKNKQIIVTSDFDVNNNKLINVNNPTENQDASTKIYTDSADISIITQISQNYLNLDQTVQQTVIGGPQVDFINFNTGYTDGTWEGRLQWNGEDGTLEFGMPGGSVNLQIGQEELIRVRNNTGTLIENGKVVRLIGGTGGFARIGLAENSDIECMSAIGVTTEDIADNAFGYVTTRGMVRNLNTMGFVIGDIIWLSSAGTYTNIKPEAPLISFIIGIVVKVNETDGIIYVSMQSIPPLTKLSDVHGVPIDGDLLSWNSNDVRFQYYNISGITDNISAESSIRLSSDISLSTAISSESSIRSSIDTSLSSEINNKIDKFNNIEYEDIDDDIRLAKFNSTGGVDIQETTPWNSVLAYPPKYVYSTTYDLDLEDTDQILLIDNSSLVEITVPEDFITGSGFTTSIFQYGTGTVRVISGNNVTILSANNENETRTRYSMVNIIKIDENLYILGGDLS